MDRLTALLAGALFGLGLAVSGMTQPGKVIGFLDFTGHWNPSLAFVMGGALAVFAPAYFWVRRRRTKPYLGDRFDVPTKTEITPQLGLGAAIFGAGWGVAGFCPGTAITALPTGSVSVLLLVVGVFVGILVTWGAQAALRPEPVQVNADF
jgi:uncharacterized membrane protein YedE/YeeE